MKIDKLLKAGAVGLMSLVASAGMAFAATTVVYPGDMQGWGFGPENISGSQTGQMVNGPATPPEGNGSAQLTLSANNEGMVLATSNYQGKKFADITTLQYSTYRSSGETALAITLAFDFDNNVTDSDNSFKGRVVYEPYHTQTVLTGVWQTWDTLNDSAGNGTGNWWLSNGTQASTYGCSQTNPCTWAQLLIAVPDGGIRTTANPNVWFKAGSGWTGGFDGNVDALNVNGDVYDFELSIPDTTAPTVPVNGLPDGTFEPDNEFNFTWNASTDDSDVVMYEFQSSMNPAEVDGVLTTGLWSSGTLTSPMIHSSGAPDGIWYWQVRAKDEAGNYSDWSEIWDVTLDSVAPSAPILISPANNSTVTTSDFQFDWDDVSDPSGVTYTWQMSYDPAFTTVAITHTGLSDSFVNSPGTPDNVYYWRVSATDGAGHASVWSSIWKVTVNTQPAIVLQPTNKDQCKNNGWESFTTLNFKNQGSCVSYVQANSHANKK